MNKNRIREYLDSLPAEGLPSFDVIIRKDHEEVFRYLGGFADAAKTQPIQPDSRYLMFSMTKIQTMTGSFSSLV